jgi:GT2 family glycosyltransferase
MMDETEGRTASDSASLEFNLESIKIGFSLELSGWVFDSARPVSQVAALISIGNRTRRVVATFPLRRPDVEKAKGAPEAVFSGFFADGLPPLHAAHISLEISYLDATNEKIDLGLVSELLHKHQRTTSDDAAKKRYPYLSSSDIFERLDRSYPISNKRLRRPVDILVPVYRGRDYIPDFFASLLASELQDASVIIVDDGNDDSVVSEYLQSENLGRPNVKIIRKQKNEGFVLAICTAFDSRAHEGDIVLLNTDTILPKRWLNRLIEPLQTSQQIASTTPFTNSGTICSFPLPSQDNVPFLDMTVADIDSVFARFDAEALMLETPTGVGFCMGMSADAISKIGFLDRVSFGRGYGEENDWCLRAHDAGFKNTIVPNLYVHHKRCGSFSPEEKQALVTQHNEIVAARYPHYRESVVQYQQANPLAAFRAIISALLTCNRYNFRPTIWKQSLFFDRTEKSLEWLFSSDPVAICYDAEAVGREPAIGIRVQSRVTCLPLARPVHSDQLHRLFQVSPGTPPAPDILVAEFEIVHDGVPYLSVLQNIHEKLAPRTYVEIGVRHGHSLALAQCVSIGIDPAPQLMLELKPQHTLYEMTSDRFFEKHASESLFQNLDFAFIDGMHWFEFALRDFMNLERHAHGASLVVFDDIFPNHPRQAERYRQTRVWTGDIWKIVPCLKQYRPDLLLLTLDAAQAGLLIVAGLDPTNRELERHYPTICRQFRDESPKITREIISRTGAIEANDPRVSELMILLREQRSLNRTDKECHVALRKWQRRFLDSNQARDP